MTNFLRLFWRDTCGAFAIWAGLGFMGLILGVGVAVDYSRLEDTRTEAQDTIDGAVLAAARYIADTELSADSAHTRQVAAKRVANEYLAAYTSERGYSMTLDSLIFANGEVIANGTTMSTPYFANLVGVNSLDVEVTASVTIGGQEAKDVDVVLIADATGSMEATLTGIQDNMKQFTNDLSNELNGSGIKLGRVRVQFIFYRDYMVDVHKDWTGPTMALQPGLETVGPMYISPFFTVPAEKQQMDNYVDYFQAMGGGSFRESGLEAVWLGLNTSWGSGDQTVRSIVLWTDAETRPLGDTVEVGLTPEPAPSTAYWSDEYWRIAMGDAFVALSKQQREAFVYNAFYPADMPNTLGGIERKFANFHEQNSNSIPDVKTMAVNVVSNCWDSAACTDWPEIGTWDGVDLTISPVGVSSTETYDLIVEQVAETVISQVTAKDSIITH